MQISEMGISKSFIKHYNFFTFRYSTILRCLTHFSDLFFIMWKYFLLRQTIVTKKPCRKFKPIFKFLNFDLNV